LLALPPTAIGLLIFWLQTSLLLWITANTFVVSST
jgi:hypothetical protein